MNGMLQRLAMLGFQQQVDELQALNDQVLALAGVTKRAVPSTSLHESASEKLRLGGNLTRAEAAAHLGISTRKLQRMELSGKIGRCPGLGTTVPYAARDVLRLAQGR